MMDPENKLLHQRAMQLGLFMCDLSLAIIHLKQSIRIEFDEEEDRFLAELILQKGLTDIQVSGRLLGNQVGKMRGNFAHFIPKYFEAYSYLMGDRKKEALDTLDSILKDNPSNIEAYILKGMVILSSEGSMVHGRYDRR